MKTLKLKHFVLMGTAVLQVVIFILFLARLFNGTTVLSYLDKGRYEKAVTLINKYEKLSGNEEITEKIKNIAVDTKNDFISGSLSFAKAEKTIEQLSALNEQSCKNIIDDAGSCINAINSGDNAMKEEKFDEALEYYGSLSNEDTDIMKIKSEKIRSVYNVMSDELVKLAGEKKYADIMSDITKLKEETTDSDLLKHIAEWEDKYLSEWIELQRSQHNYTGPYGAFRLAAEYEKLTGKKDAVSSVDSELQQYIMNEIGNQNYSKVLEMLDADFDAIKEYCGEQGENTYNDFRITCATALLNQAKENGEYTGDNGAIRLAEKLNSYREGAADKTVYINELAARERYALIDKINATRKAAGLSELLSTPELENSAYAMMSKLNNGSYDDNDLYAVLSENNVRYKKACCAWNDNAASADEVFSKFTPIEDFGILTEPELKRIGVGMKFDEASQNFSWFIIEILTEE